MLAVRQNARQVQRIRRGLLPEPSRSLYRILHASGFRKLVHAGRKDRTAYMDHDGPRLLLRPVRRSPLDVSLPRLLDYKGVRRKNGQEACPGRHEHNHR